MSVATSQSKGQQKPSLKGFDFALKKGCIVDTRHDFPLTVQTLKMPKFKNSYNQGLPKAYDDNDIVDEETYLQSIVASYQVETSPGSGTFGPPITTSQTKPYVPIAIANPKFKSGYTSTHKITTINGHSYTVKYSDVKTSGVLGTGVGKKVITAQQFYERLGIKETNIAIVIDAASISFIEILVSGPKFTVQGKRPNVYYMYGPEVVNDPATKKAPDSKEFGKEAGANLIACVPMSPADFIYSYNWDNNQTPNTVYLDQFFTNYNFDLSELKVKKTGSSGSYITDLKITDQVNKVNNILIDSKSKNDINFLQSILKKLLDSLTGTKNQFMMSSSYQQKRSGDWLQVLLCSALKDKARAFKTYPNGKDNIVKLVERVFFVTHDRVAAAFNLLCGNDTFYTHHQPVPSFHSCFSYTLDNPEKVRADTISRANDCKTEVNELVGKLTALKGKLNNYINGEFAAYVTSKNEQLMSIINSYIDSGTPTPFNVTNINDSVHKIFTTCLQVIQIKKLVPDLSGYLSEIDENIVELRRIAGLNNSSETSNVDPVVSKEIISSYNTINTNFENIIKIHTEAINNIGLVKTEVGNLSKSFITIAANLWKWDTSDITRRNIQSLQDVTDTKNFGSDRNVFLYSINDIGDDVKMSISGLYYIYYSFIMNSSSGSFFTTNISGRTDPLNDIQFEKFKAVTLSFCVEVLLCLGNNGAKMRGIDIGTGTTTQQEQFNTIMSNGVAIQSLSPVAINKIINDFASKKIENSQLTDAIIVKENRNYNNQVKSKTFDGGVDSFEQPFQPNIDENAPIFSMGTVGKKKVNRQQGGENADENGENADENGEIIEQVDRQFGGSDSTAAFEFTTNQVTYPLMAYILLNPVWYKNLYDFVKDESPELLEDSVEQEETVNNEKIDEESMEATITKTIVDKTANLFKSLKTSGNEVFSTNEAEDMDSDEAQSITDPFLNNTICFHPLLPIYMITQAYYDTISNEYIHESNDFELFINYYKYLQVLSSNVIKIYERQDDATVSQSQTNNKVTAYAIGLGLKELLFTANNSQQGYTTCLETLGLRDEDFSEISSLTHLLSSSMIGKPELNVRDEIIGKMFLESSIFEEFVQSVGLIGIFNETLDQNFVYEYNSFKSNVFGFLDKLARKIIEDRGETIEHDSAYVPSSTSTETPSSTLSDSENNLQQMDDGTGSGVQLGPSPTQVPGYLSPTSLSPGSQVQSSLGATPAPTSSPTVAPFFGPSKRTGQDTMNNYNYANKKRFIGFDEPINMFERPNMTAISVRGGLSKKYKNKIKRHTKRAKTSRTNKIKSRKQNKTHKHKRTHKKTQKRKAAHHK
jgi:hypothetical protein